MKISVIIPIYNSEEFLNKLLDSIKYQTLEKEKYEVVFVDNNSDDKSKEILKKFCKKSIINTRYLFYDKKQSSYASRNYGVKHAKGSILAFTDADCILDKNWLKNIDKFYNKNSKDIIISGTINLFIEDETNIWEWYDKIVFLDNKKYFYRNKTATTANLIVSKKNFLEIGFFEEVVSSGDKSWAKRAINLNKEIKFSENILVNHPSRKTFGEIKKKTYRIAYGKGQLKYYHNKILSIETFKNILRIIYLKTNLIHSKKIYEKAEISLKEIIKFNFYFIKLRLIHLIGFYRGFVSARGER
ncbi:MAG: glycosyltransferase [archaeon]